MLSLSPMPAFDRRPNRRAQPAVLLAGALFAACSSANDLPSGFTLGTATAGFQVDMGCPTLPAERCEDRASDWYVYATSTAAKARMGTFLKGDPPSGGPGMFETYAADFDRMRGLGLGAYRFSVEWSRVFPRSTRGVDDHEALRALADPEALAFYKAQLAALRARGLRPFVTLHHYTLPTWVHDGVGCTLDFARCSPRGWLEPWIVDEIAKYAGFVARELGAEVDVWATMNEPFAVVLAGYLQPTATRSNPPAQTLRWREAKTVMLAMIQAHARMVDAVRAADAVDADGDGRAAELGIVYPVAPILPKDPTNPLDQAAAENLSYVYNDVFMNAVAKGVLDDDLDGAGEPRADLAGRLDWFGLNYYFKVVVEGTTESFLPDLSPLLTANPLTLEQGAVYAEGIRDMLRKVHEAYGLPVYITENGATPETDGGQERFLAEHLQHVLLATREDGVDVRGYFWWSYVDNYEWNHGFEMRFGLYGLAGDAAKTRVERPVAALLRSIAEAQAIPDAVVERYPVAR